MTVLQGVLAGAGLVAVLIGLLWRLFAHFDAKNESRIEQLDMKNERAWADRLPRDDPGRRRSRRSLAPRRGAARGSAAGR